MSQIQFNDENSRPRGKDDNQVKNTREVLSNITNLNQTRNDPKRSKNKNNLVTEKRKLDPMMIEEWENIDANDYDDPQALTDYVDDIYEHLRIKERLDKVPSTFLKKQSDINEKMRAILVDWLVEVHRMFKLIPETLFLSVNIIDRYLFIKPVPRDKLQLLGITSMHIASKFEEIYAPESNDFVYISDGAFAKDQIMTMEQQVLNALNFNLLHPAPLHFLRRFSKAAASDYTIHTLCKYLIELMLLDVTYLKYYASEIAAASVYVARAMTCRYPLWTPTLEHYTTYSEEHIRPIAIDVNNYLRKYRDSSLKALRKKYASPKFGEVSDMPLVEL